MNTPAFWQSKNIISTLLLPLAALYGMGVTRRQARTIPQTLPVPVICIGNLTAGGAGKTPVALHIGEKMHERGMRVFFLSRGYGGALAGPLLVTPQHTAAEVGDEPLLLAQRLPTVIAKNRLAGARFAIAQGAELIIMDDGYQNPAIAKDMSILVINGAQGFGNGRLLPAGPLREPIDAGLRRAQAAIIIGDGDITLPPGLPVLRASVQPLRAEIVKGKHLLAFCGLAYPQKFFHMLRDMGAASIEAAAFADHHTYRPAEVKALLERAQKEGRLPVTTAKDAVRLPPDLRAQVAVIDIRLAFADETGLDTLLAPLTHRHETT